MSDNDSNVISSDEDSDTATLGEAVRTQHPVYVDRMPPCNLTCPAGENIQEWIQFVADRRYEDAWRALTRANPMPAIHGRVCYHPCEKGCNRKRLEEPVSIHSVERFLGDLAISEGWKFTPLPSTGKRVLVIGSGPCGLSAAYHLGMAGHQITVHESSLLLGGMMRYAIPEYRLSRDVLNAEIDRIAQMGVTFKTSCKTEDLEGLLKSGEYDAIVLAIGAQLSKRIDIPADDAGKILDALNFLAAAGERPTYCVGRRVAVYGGGNTAMDAARTALRLGASESIIIYRRDQAHMPAHQHELDEALSEGVACNWLRTVKQVEGGQIQVEIMELDAKGKPQATGRFETIQADMLILALGQETQSDFLKKVPGIVVNSSGEVEVDNGMMTGHPGIFAGGDMIPANKTVTTAVGHGKRTSRHVNAYLEGRTYTAAPKRPPAKFDRLHVEGLPRIPQAKQPVEQTEVSYGNFKETLGGLSESAAHDEARRCLSCGNCNECETCYKYCPNQAILELGDGMRYQIYLGDCIGCGLCAAECPAGAIDMVSEKA